MEWAPECKGCCFEEEPWSAWFKCDYCTRNPNAIEQREDKFRPLEDKYIFFNR